MSTLANAMFYPAQYEAGCLGKEPHATEAASRAALEFYQAEGALRTGGGVQPYKCDFCPFWHLGHGRAHGPRLRG